MKPRTKIKLCGVLCFFILVFGFQLVPTNQTLGLSIVFISLALLIFCIKADRNTTTSDLATHGVFFDTSCDETEETSSETYIELNNSIQRADGQPISDEKVPYLIQLDHKYKPNKKNILINLTEQEELFFDELKKALSEINRSITMERLSNGVISVYSNTYYVGKIKLSGRKHWMQVLRGETQIKTIEGEIDDFIQQIPNWIRYISLHCK